MYAIIKILHSYWAYLLLLVLVLATFNALIKYFGDKEFHAKDFRISLFALIVMHIQLLLGLVLYFVSPNGFQSLSNNGINSYNSLLAVEHPFVGVLSVVFITIGYSKHKKKLTSRPKFKMLAIFYTIALLLVFSRIPWQQWL